MLKSGSAVSRMAAIAILIALIAGAYFVLVAPVLDDYREYKANIDQSRDLIARYQARRPDIASLEMQVKRLSSNRSFSGAFLRGKNASLAAANLQGRIDRLVKSLNGKLTSAQSIPTRDKETFQKVIVRAQVILSTDAMRRLLHRLESARPYLFLDNVVIRKAPQIRRRVRRNTRLGSRPEQEDVDHLDVRFDVYGYLWQGNPA